MVKNKSPKPVKDPKTSFIFPSLHDRVVEAISNDITSTHFCKNSTNKPFNHEYDTHVMGRFRCKTSTCLTNVWSSKKVAIRIRGYAGNGYHAEVFNQRCQVCNQLGILMLDKQSYVDRVAYRIRKWAGITMEPPVYNQRAGKPHKADLCEGCKRGVCRQIDNQESD